jgi:hypothetical protein
MRFLSTSYYINIQYFFSISAEEIYIFLCMNNTDQNLLIMPNGNFYYKVEIDTKK